MVFPSVPVYLDPLNWPQQQTNQQSGVGVQNPQLSYPPQPPPSTVAVGGGSQLHQGSNRPGSMADRARQAKIQPPEAALKCPRCESTNTKFCYYNNYSLLQPRHFCKTCRRYWTRGGTMRNVPVGGGCRRNKRSKGSSSRSKSPIKDDPQASSSTARANSSSTCTTNAIGHLPTLAPSQMPLFPTSHHYNDYFSKGMGLHFGAIPPPVVVANGNTASSIGFEFQIGTSSGENNCGSVLPNGLIEQWRLPNQQVHQQQFPFLNDLETQAQIGLSQFVGENVDEQPSYVGDRSRLWSKTLDSDSSVREMPHEVSSERKVDENQGFSLSKNLLGNSGNDQFWAASGNTWNNIPSFTSSTSHLL